MVMQAVRQPPRVLCLRSVDGPGGGAEAIILRTAARAASAGFRMSVCCIHGEHDVRYDFDRRATESGVDYYGVAQRSILARGVLPAIRQIVRRLGVTIVDAQDYKASYFAMRLARLEGVVPMATFHGWTGHSPRERYFYYPAERMIARGFPLVVAVSSPIRDELIRWGNKPNRIHVVLNGIDPSEFRRDDKMRRQVRETLGLRQGDVALGAVGRLEPQKRFDVLMEAMKLLLPRHPNMRLFIVGSGSLERCLESQVRELGLNESCRLLGHRNDVREIYQAFDAFVQSSDYEGTPTVVVEAMASELPVVAPDVGGTGEVLQDGGHGLLVPPRDPQALAGAIEQTLDDREATRRRTAAARKRVEDDLTFDARMRNMAGIYSTLAAQWRRTSRDRT